MKPLIKYTGGKYNEYKDLKSFLPERINNYFEPFFGGGGLFFQLHNNGHIQGKSFINDLSKPLMDFYKSIGDDKFYNELDYLSDVWEKIKEFSDTFSKKYYENFVQSISSKDKNKIINEEMIDYVVNEINKLNINQHNFSLSDIIISSIKDKVNRFINKNKIEGDMVCLAHKSLSTSICQGFYFFIREMYNDWNNGGNEKSYQHNEKISHFLFIREFCFGGMHRFNKEGDFNIPYGGYSYNRKCFKCKINKIKSKETKKIFRKCMFDCDDFQKVLNKYTFGSDDFIFLDPPYDSTFSEYDGNEFTRKDHIRLKEILSKINCKWLIAIGKTDFIEDLYKDYNIVEYDKTYAYQARGTYDNKKTKHLIITNY